MIIVASLVLLHTRSYPAQNADVGHLAYIHAASRGSINSGRKLVRSAASRLAATGGNWMGVGPDRFWRPDVRAQFLTDDGAVVLMHYRGFRVGEIDSLVRVDR